MQDEVDFGQKKSFWKVWTIFMMLSLIVVLLIVAPAFVPPKWQMVIMQGFAPVCHQISERSPQLNGAQLAVCHRCFGTYAGIFAGLIAGLIVVPYAQKLWKYAGLIIALSLIPLGLDWGLHFVGLWENTSTSRVATGILFGLAAGLCLLVALWRANPGPARQAS